MPSRMSGSGWEALLNDWQWLGGLSGCPGVVGRPDECLGVVERLSRVFGSGRRPSRMSGSDREAGQLSWSGRKGILNVRE